MSESILSLERRLEREGFCRVHRSYLVNLDFVHNVAETPSGLLELELEGVDKRVPVSRRRMSDVKERLGMA